MTSLTSFRLALERMPSGTLLPRDQLLEVLASEGDDPPRHPEPVATAHVTESWRERLWSCPAETRLGVEELTEALGRSKSWLYHRTGAKAESRIPHRRLDGTLVFLAGEVREWVRTQEETIVPARVDRLRAV